MSRVTVDGEVVREFVTVGVQGPPGVDSMPPGGGAGEALVKQSGANFDADWSEVVDATARGDASQALLDAATADGKAVAAQGDIDAHVADLSNPHATSAAQVGADPSGTAASVVSAHNAATTSVHGISDTGDLIVEGDPRLADARVPTSHASTHAVGGSDEVSAAAIGAASVAEVQAAQSTADAAIPSSEKGQPDGVATLDAGGVVPTPQILYGMALGLPPSAILAWDDFRTDSADINGRVAPSGQVWETFDEDGALVVGQCEVTDGAATFTTSNARRIAALPIGSSNGLMCEAWFGTNGGVSTRGSGFVIVDEHDNYLLWMNDTRDAWLEKRVNGVQTSLVGSSAGQWRFNNNFDRALYRISFISNVQPDGRYEVGVSLGGSRVFTNVTDAEALAILRSEHKRIGILGRRRVLFSGFVVARWN